MTKKVLVLGGTGAMGVYLVPELVKKGFAVDVTTRKDYVKVRKKVNYIKGDAHDMEFVKRILYSKKYDAIVDFMNYSTTEFAGRFMMFLDNCEHYVFLSSYRVFADSKIINEESPRLLDVSKDQEYLKTDDYSLAKAKQEDILKNASKKNWTIVRPAITYSKERFQLGTMELDTVVWRALQNLPVVLPTEMLNVLTTMTWAGDVSRLIAKLVLNDKAKCEAYNISTSECHTWEEVAEIYNETIGLKVMSVSLGEYIEAMGGGLNYYQVMYDRMFNRVLDNKKILQLTGEYQTDFLPLKDGLKRELNHFISSPSFAGIDYRKQANIDKLTNTTIDLHLANPEEKEAYLEIRYPKMTKIKLALRPRTRVKKAGKHIIGLTRQLKQHIHLRTRVKNIVDKINSLLIGREIKKADGVIITLTGYFNYGNIIQRFALQEFLRQQGYKFISYAREPLDISGSSLARFTYTGSFVKRYIWRKEYDSNDNFPIYIVGSDQVWRNWGHAHEIEEFGYYFLNFIKNRTARRVAYAASFGYDNTEDARISPDFVKYAKPLLENFNAISVRESSGSDILSTVWGLESQLVIDPTMLLTFADYDCLIRKSPHRLVAARPIFAYILVMSESKHRIISEVERSMAGKCDIISLEEEDVLPPVEQWLKGYRDSDFIVTDSFHGTVFAILNNTPFLVVENTAGGITRITNLLKEFSLEDRLIKEKEARKFEFSKFGDIDWQKVNDKLIVMRKKSADWLISSLGKVE